MDRDSRLRIALVALLALGVMGGVVASALVARQHGYGESDGGMGPVSRRGGEEGFGNARGGRHDRPMPDDCDVDPAHPPAIRIELPDGGLDFGPVKQGVELTREVRIRNVGSGVLCVPNVITGCGCVHADWEGDIHVAPGASHVLKVRVDTMGKEGPLEKDVRLFTNDPARNETSFKVKFDVRLGILVAYVPGAGATGVQFGNHAPGNPATQAIRLATAREAPPFEVLGVESAGPEGDRTKFTWTVVPVEMPDPVLRYVDVMLNHPGRTKMGAAIERIRIRTSSPERPEILLDTVFNVVERFYASPQVAKFGNVRRDDATAKRIVHIASGEATADFAIKGVRVEGKGFVAGEPTKVTEGYTVEVRYDGQARKEGALKAVLVVEIEDASASPLRVPIEAWVIGT